MSSRCRRGTAPGTGVRSGVAAAARESHRRAAGFAAAVAGAMALLLGPPGLAAAALAAKGGEQPRLERVASRPVSVPRRSPWLDAGADQEQLGEPVEAGGGEVGAATPAWARSLEVGEGGAAVRARPDSRSAERRGRLGPGMRFPLLDRWHGPGCARGPWYRVGAGAWVCAAEVSLSPAEPVVGPYPALARDQLVPFRYAFSGGAGTRTYARPSDVTARRHAGALGSHWGLAIVERELWRGRPMVRTSRGTWVAARALRWVEPSRFAGVVLPPGPGATAIPVAWVRRGGAPTYTEASDRRRVGHLSGRARVRAGGELRAGARTFTRLGDGLLVESRLLVRPERIATPTGVAPGERWLDVDLARQTLVAYEGSEPVFATLVSTGRHAGSTPRGLFRIRIKLAHDTMDRFVEGDPENTYSMDGVPWVQYFTSGVALHGVYWHDRFGAVASHGCVNLAPRDARWLYAFTRPHVPDGWAVVLPNERERGTPVYVR